MTERELWSKCVDYCIKNEIVGFHLMFDEFIKMRDAQGFVLVPRKPTQQIYRAFYDAFNSANAGNTAQRFKVGYKAMLSAVEVQNGLD